MYREEKTGQAKLSYQLLNASAHFKEVVEQAHAVVLAGGTMQPMTGQPKPQTLSLNLNKDLARRTIHPMAGEAKRETLSEMRNPKLNANP